MQTLIKLFTALALLALANTAFAHCLIPDEATLTFHCESRQDNVKVRFSLFSQSDPRNCPALISLTDDETQNGEAEFIGYGVKVQPREYGRTDISATFDQTSDMIVSYRESRSFPGLLTSGEDAVVPMICVQVD